MRILIIFPSFKNYSERLKLYCEMSNFSEVENVIIFTRELHNDVNVKNFGNTKIFIIKDKFKFYFKIKNIIKKEINNEKDIIIINHFINLIYFGKDYKRTKNIKNITKFYFPNLIIFKRKRIKFSLRQKILLLKRSLFDLLSILTSDVIIGNSKQIEELVNEVIKKIKIKRSIFTLPTPVDTELFHPMKIKKEENYYKLLFVGNLLERKGIFDLIEVAKLLRDANIRYVLYLVGRFNQRKVEKDVNSLISKYELINNIEFIGKLKQKELVDYYNNCDLFIFPSYYEGSPRVAKEAMACGLPVVAYDIAGIKLIDKGRNIIQVVNVGNIDGLFRKIIELISDEKKLKDLSSKSVKHIRENFSIGIIAQEEVMLYQSLLNMKW